MTPPKSRAKKQALPVGLQKLVDTYELSERAREIVRERAAQTTFVEPEYEPSLAAELALADEEAVFTIDQLHIAGGNTLFVAEKKAGKTTTALNAAAALADGVPFLGHFAVSDIAGRVGFWDNELIPRQFRRWARDMEIAQPENIVSIHWKTQRVRPDLTSEIWRKWAVDWLQENDIKFWIIDPAAALLTPFGDETSNSDMSRMTEALDIVKARAGVPDLLLSIHTGRQEFAEDQERSRGATRFEDWMDAGWYLTKGTGENADARFLRAYGRDVELETILLAWDYRTRRVTHSGKTRSQDRTTRLMKVVVIALGGLGDGVTTTALEEALHIDKNARSRAIREAEGMGYITREKAVGRPGNPMLCTLTELGRRLVSPAKIKVTNEPSTPDAPSITPEGRKRASARISPSPSSMGEGNGQRAKPKRPTVKRRITPARSKRAKP